MDRRDQSPGCAGVSVKDSRFAPVMFVGQARITERATQASGGRVGDSDRQGDAISAQSARIAGRPCGTTNRGGNYLTGLVTCVVVDAIARKRQQRATAVPQTARRPGPTSSRRGVSRHQAGGLGACVQDSTRAAPAAIAAELTRLRWGSLAVATWLRGAGVRGGSCRQDRAGANDHCRR